MPRPLFLSLALIVALSAPAISQTTDDADTERLIRERASESVQTLVPLLEARSAAAEKIAAKVAEIEAASEAEKEPLNEELNLLNDELAALEDQISVVATGVSEESFREQEPAQFDIRTELQRLVEPFLTLLLDATQEARDIETTRRDLTAAEQRYNAALTAMDNLDAALTSTEDSTVTSELAEKRLLWDERLATSESQVAALKQQLEDLLLNRVTAGRHVQTAFQGFFRERGLSFLLGVTAFVTVMMVCRLIARMTRRYMERTRRPRTFTTRLVGLLFSVFTVAASFAAMLIVFNLRNDWLLLGLAAILLVALIWIGIRMMPSLFEQVTVLLNLGSVQEDERIVLNGVPYNVARLSFYTDLVNPALDGGEFTLPVRELIGLHSRPAADSEAWFPSEKGDWVRLADGNAGQVVVQTPEMVVVELLGGAHVTYQTADFLAQTPENLSRGFRVETEFGIDYRHQAEATGSIIETMRAGVAAQMTAFVGADHIRDVEVEFLRAGASSLDFEVEVDVTGDAAPRFEEIERELARVLVRLATEQGWEIPFQQVVLHQMPAAAAG